MLDYQYVMYCIFFSSELVHDIFLLCLQAFSCLPEKRVVFTGKKTNNVAEEEKKFDVKPHIIYPMEEGTALITFEKEVGKIFFFV